jgi:hypothetical protein
MSSPVEFTASAGPRRRSSYPASRLGGDDFDLARNLGAIDWCCPNTNGCVGRNYLLASGVVLDEPDSAVIDMSKAEIGDMRLADTTRADLA